MQLSLLSPAPRSGRIRDIAGRLIASLVVFLALAFVLVPAVRAENVEFTDFEVTHTDDGVNLDFGLRFELPHNVEEALVKGVPLYFVAEAQVLRDRWYWRDKRVAAVTRTWRVAFQPLTRKYRVTFGGLNQSFETLADAMSAVRRVSGWKIAEAGQIEDGARHYVEFSYRLDTTLLPRPMQIGLAGQAEWTLLIEKVQRIN